MNSYYGSATDLKLAPALANRRGLCNSIQQETVPTGLHNPLQQPYAGNMATLPTGAIAVIFVAQRTAVDDDGYVQAAIEMDALSRRQPGYIGMDSARSAEGLGITVSYWESDAHAKAWRDNASHVAIREAGRDRWYSYYSLHVGSITRSYDWQKP